MFYCLLFYVLLPIAQMVSPLSASASEQSPPPVQEEGPLEESSTCTQNLLDPPLTTTPHLAAIGTPSEEGAHKGKSPETFKESLPKEEEDGDQEELEPFSSPWHENEQALSGEISYQQAAIRMVCALTLLLALLFISVLALKKASTGKLFYQKQRSSGDILEVLGHTVLSPKSIVYVIQVGDHKVVITESHSDVSVDALSLPPEKNLEAQDPKSKYFKE